MRVEQSDESHVSPLESSSSFRPNQLDLLDFLQRLESFVGEFLLDDDDEWSRRKNPSMAEPITRASTIALRPSHFNRLNGDLCSFAFFCGFVSFDVDSLESVDVIFSNASLAKETVALAALAEGDRGDGDRLAIGWCRLANHPPCAARLVDDPDLPSSVPVICLIPFNTDTSKLFDRLDFLKLVLRSTFKKLCGIVGVLASPIRLISVAEEASDESNEIRSVFVHTIPLFLDGVGQGDNILGFSDALRLMFGVTGGREVGTKSEYRLFVYRTADELDPASSNVCTSQTFSLLVFQSFIRAFFACTISSIISNCKL